MFKKLITFIFIAAVLMLSTSGCAVMFPGIYPSYYYDAGYCPWVDGVWISGPYHGHTGYWAHRHGYVNNQYRGNIRRGR
jgi:hypothetical protein